MVITNFFIPITFFIKIMSIVSLKNLFSKSIDFVIEKKLYFLSLFFGSVSTIGLSYLLKKKQINSLKEKKTLNVVITGASKGIGK
jgi:hypothetical protein